MSDPKNQYYQNPLFELLPHRPPLLLLDQAHEKDGEFEALIQVREESLLYEKGKGVPAWAGVEYLAQASGVFSKLKLGDEEEPPVGFLVKVKSYSSTRTYFLLGEELKVRIDPIYVDSQKGQYRGSIYVGEQKLCESVFITFAKRA